MNSNIHVFETPVETARATAVLILEKALEKHKLSLPFNIALSGGNTPKLLFSILANEFMNKMPWHFVRLFWVDERCVPPTHAESNFGMTYENLLKYVPIHDDNIFRMMGEIKPDNEVVRYKKLLENQLTIKNGMPQFDLILLGMGDDGHTASIFPNNLSLLYSNSSVAVSEHPVSGQKRITLTGNIINHAEKVVFLITGESKSSVLEQIIHKNNSFKEFPASYIHAQTTNAEFYLDKAAAEKLS